MVCAKGDGCIADGGCKRALRDWDASDLDSAVLDGVSLAVHSD